MPFDAVHAEPVAERSRSRLRTGILRRRLETVVGNPPHGVPLWPLPLQGGDPAVPEMSLLIPACPTSNPFILTLVRFGVKMWPCPNMQTVRVSGCLLHTRVITSSFVSGDGHGPATPMRWVVFDT